MDELRTAGPYSVLDAVLIGRGDRGNRDYVSVLELKLQGSMVWMMRHTSERAADKHSDLKTALREGGRLPAGYEVHLHTIALGVPRPVAGTRDVSLPGTLAELAVPPKL